MAFHTSIYTIYVKIKNSNRYLLVHGYTGAIDIVRHNVVQFLKQGGKNNFPDELHISTATIDVLKKRGYLTEQLPLEERETVKKIAEKISRFHRREISFMFLVAYDCNFRCSYCFENEISGSGKSWSKRVLTKELIDKAYATMLKIQQNRKFHQNNITLYGGEPLLVSNKEIVSYIVNEGTKNGYVFTAITNGFDLNHYDKLLGKGKIESVQVTIDGSPEIHDKRRIHYQLKNSFNRIMKNIELILTKGVNVFVRVNVDELSLNALRELSDIFSQRGWDKLSNFKMYLALVRGENEAIDCSTVMSKKTTSVQKNISAENKKPISIDLSNMENKNVSKTLGATCGSYESYLNEQYMNFKKEDDQCQNGMPTNFKNDIVSGVEYEAISRKDFTNEYYNLMEHEQNSYIIAFQDFGIKSKIKQLINNSNKLIFRTEFCGAQTGMYIFDPYGDLYTCWEVVGMEGRKVGKYDDGLELNKDELEKWQGRNITTVEACGRCKYAFFCGCGCGAHALMEGKGLRSPYCDSFPKVFQRVVSEFYNDFTIKT